MGRTRRFSFFLFRFRNKRVERGRRGVRVVVGISGASGAIYGLRLLERLRQRRETEVHLILTHAGEKTLHLETGKLAAAEEMSVQAVDVTRASSELSNLAVDLQQLAHVWHPVEDIGSPLASGSFPADGMVIAPCSIHTMSAIATGITDNLLTRAADVMLKERRKLILVIRESPLHTGHLKNLAALSEMGAIIAPPVPAFYHNPQTILDLVDHSVDRILDLLGLPDANARRWQGP